MSEDPRGWLVACVTLGVSGFVKKMWGSKGDHRRVFHVYSHV